jgi:4,5-dihydroxyphthalate decarboxylase
MLREGSIDAAILGEVPAADSPFKPLILDPAAAARDWHRRHGAIQINHMVVVTEAIARAQPDAVREAWRLLAKGKRHAPAPPPGEPDATPFGLEANRRNLEVAIDCVYRQRLVPRRYAVDELFDDVTRTLA